MEFPVFKNVFNKPGVEVLPHRPPFLFVDRILSGDETGCVCEYTFTAEKNDFFRGHFPEHPVVPGVILIEAMAQAAGANVVARGFLGHQIAFALAAVDGVRFRQPFHPGDRLVTVAKCIRERVPLGTYEVKGYLNGEAGHNGLPAVEATVKCMMGSKIVRDRQGQA